LAALCGAELPALPIDGKNVLDLWRAEPGATSPHGSLFFWYHDTQLEAMRSGRYKLYFPHRYRSLQGRPGGSGGRPVNYTQVTVEKPELYDLVADLGETKDLSAELPDVVAQMEQTADAMRARLGDKLRGIAGTDVR
jgi:hypothetical protein